MKNLIKIISITTLLFTLISCAMVRQIKGENLAREFNMNDFKQGMHRDQLTTLSIGSPCDKLFPSEGIEQLVYKDPRSNERYYSILVENDHVIGWILDNSYSEKKSKIEAKEKEKWGSIFMGIGSAINNNQNQKENNIIVQPAYIQPGYVDLRVK